MATYGTFVDGVSLKAAEANDFLKWTSFSPSVFQGVNPGTKGATFGKYARVNKFVLVIIYLEIAGSGSGAGVHPVQVDLPLAASSSSMRVIGRATFFDFSTDYFNAFPVLNSTTTCTFLSNTATSLTNYVGFANGPQLTLANNDVIRIQMMYEAA